MPNYVDALGDAVRGAIRAFHGSPYDFDAFDAAKIGTGEGAQAYGHGLYFAGDEGVARHYRDMLAHDPPYVSAEEAAAEYLASNGGDVDRTLKVLGMHALAPSQFGYVAADQQNIIRQARELLASGANIAPRERVGSMYEVQIGHPQQSLLDWDAPMSQQPKKVRKAFGHMAMDMPGDGRRVYEDIATRLGEGFDDDLSGVRAHSAAAEELLQEGIPGIRYLDRNSRIGGKGNRNYVMFPGTEDSIRILRKYGIGGAAAGAAMSDEEQY